VTRRIIPMILAVTLAAVFFNASSALAGTNTGLTGTVDSSPLAGTSIAIPATSGWYHWSTVGTDPLWTSANGQKGVANPEEFIKMMTSSKGRECARRSGIPTNVWAAAIDKVKSGQYTRKGMPSGSLFRSMCFGVSGVSVVPNVEWSGNGPLGGREITVQVDNLLYHIFTPDGCANVVWWTQSATRVPPITLVATFNKVAVKDGTPINGVTVTVQEKHAGSAVASWTLVSGTPRSVRPKHLGDQFCELFKDPWKNQSAKCVIFAHNGQLINYRNIMTTPVLLYLAEKKNWQDANASGIAGWPIKVSQSLVRGGKTVATWDWNSTPGALFTPTTPMQAGDQLQSCEAAADQTAHSSTLWDIGKNTASGTCLTQTIVAASLAPTGQAAANPLIWLNRLAAPSTPSTPSQPSPQPQPAIACTLNGTAYTSMPSGYNGVDANGVCINTCSNVVVGNNNNVGGNCTTTIVVTPPSTCPSGTVGTPPNCQTPSADVSFNDVQEVNTNESRANTCATVTTNLPMTVQVSADHGSWSSVSPSSVNGSQLVCGTYTGPSEVGTDVWHVKVYYNGVLVKDATHTIPIVNPQPNP